MSFTLISWGDLSSDTFEVLNFTHKYWWNNYIFSWFHKISPTFVYSWNETCKTLTHILPATASNDPYPKFFQSRIGKLLTYLWTRVLYEKLRVNCTCVERVIFCRFRTQWISISILAIENKKILSRFGDQKCQIYHMNLCAEFCTCNNILRACPKVGACQTIGDLLILRVCGCKHK